MGSIKIILVCLALLYVPIMAVEMELQLSFNNLFVAALTTDTVFFNDRSFHNNTMSFAACNSYHNNKILTCAVHLIYPTSEVTANYLKCETSYYYRNGHSVDRLLTLEPMYNNRVLFKWLVVDKNDYMKDPFVMIRVINMQDCEYKDSKVPLGESPHYHGPNYAIYNNSFDVFFRNKSLCGDLMCGETFDIDGEIIHGPVASYLKADYFKKTALMCPAKSGTSAGGHFLLTSKILLVSAMSGQVKELMDFPDEVVNFAYNCDNGFLGICWLEALNDVHINCRQFDSQGNQVLNTKADLGYNLGKTMSMRNQQDGGILLQTNECGGEEDWCEENLSSLVYSVHKIDKDGAVKMLFNTTDVACEYGLEVGINDMPNKDICITFGCLSASNVPQTNIQVRTIFYTVGLRNVTATVPSVDSISTEAPVKQYPTKKPVKPTKKKGPRWHV